MSVESADENFERKRNEMKTMVGLEIAKTQKTLGFSGHWVTGSTSDHQAFDDLKTLQRRLLQPFRSILVAR